MRTIDIARRAGCSIQQVRKLEEVGVLPPAPRTAAGYREWDDTHLAGVLAYQQLTSAIGPVEARLLVTEARRDQLAMLTRLDAAQARLHQERLEIALARSAVESISAEPLHSIDPADSMSVGELALALGVRPSTLRHWEAERLLHPGRSSNGARTYSPVDVRDARLLHQLRQAGHRIRPLRDLLPMLHTERTWAEVLAGRELDVRTRSRALLYATDALLNYLDACRSRPEHADRPSSSAARPAQQVLPRPGDLGARRPARETAGDRGSSGDESPPSCAAAPGLSVDV